MPAIAQDVDGTVLMMAWMNADTLRMTFDEGRMVYWSRSRQEVWRKGDTSGDVQEVREAYYDCDGDVLLFKVVQHGRGACHTGARSCFFRALRGPRVRIRPSRDELPRARRRRTPSSRCGPSCWPTWRPRWPPTPSWSATSQGFLLESVEHGERWSRFSFVGRDPVATLILRDGSLEVDGRSRSPLPTDRGILAALEELLATYRAPAIAELPPLHGGLMGYLGYDVIREVERLPTSAARRPPPARTR